MSFTSIEMCAGAGGEALGLEKAGFEHIDLIEIDSHACNTLRLNRPNWNVIEGDLHNYTATHIKDLDLLAGGVPCQPFSVAGKQLGKHDERDLFFEAIRLVSEAKPKAVMLENVRGLLDSVFDEYRTSIVHEMQKLGYKAEWRLLNASDFGVSQLRPRVVFVALKEEYIPFFTWPSPVDVQPLTVGELLYELMNENGWNGVDEWKEIACDIAPTLVGGSKKHGGPDLGPTRAKKAWESLGVDGTGISDQAPAKDFVGRPKLTIDMVAAIQGFPKEWKFSGKKTNAYRQIGNAFPPPVAFNVGKQIYSALNEYQMSVKRFA